MTSLSERRQVMALVAQAVTAGARQGRACDVISLSARSLQRWRNDDASSGDGDCRPARLQKPGHALSELERQQLLTIANSDAFGHLWLNHDGPARRYLTEAIFPFYIIHQTAIVVYAHNLQPLKLPIAIEAIVLITATIATCFVTFEIARRLKWLRPLFGLKRQ